MALAIPNYLVDDKFNKAMKAIPVMAAGMIVKLPFREKEKVNQYAVGSDTYH